MRDGPLRFKRKEWADLARSLDWEFTYVDEKEVFPEVVSGGPWLPQTDWMNWDEPYRNTFTEYVVNQQAKGAALDAVRDQVGRIEDFAGLDRGWLSAIKLHAATLPLAEFAAAVGNLRAGRFARTAAWRTTATFGALDELRHTQIPLLLMHDLVRWDAQFDWTHKLFHSDQWVAIAGRHLIDELLLLADPIEFSIATHFVFETGFTNLQFVGLAANAHRVGDQMIEKMLLSIQTDEARHSQVGNPVLEMMVHHDRERAQYLVDKWFWRSWLFFAVVTGIAMDYLTPLAHRAGSFKEFVEEWVLDQFQRSLIANGLALPWYWDQFLAAIESYHHMVYAGAYTYRATVWFDPVLPGPDERAWLRSKYPGTWGELDPVWENLTARCREAGPGVEWYTHGLTPIGFCRLCQLVLSGGTPHHNTATTLVHEGEKYIFCSEPCRWIFQREPKRYQGHKDVVNRILSGAAPANLLLLLRQFGLSEDLWGKDLNRGAYAWLSQKRSTTSEGP